VQRLNILAWHIHGSYLNALARIDHNWYLPIKPGKPEGYGGRGPTFDLPDYVREIPAERVRDRDIDVVIYQTHKNYAEDAHEILSDRQRNLPSIYLEHNTPKPHAVDTRHPLTDTRTLLVHVTHYNRLMWDNDDVPVQVIEHSVGLDFDIRYTGERPQGITVVNGMQKRPRIAGYDLFLTARDQVPLVAAGMETEAFGGLGDVPYRDLHRTLAEYRFMFSPIRYTSLPLAVVEAMTIGMPVAALATTELPTVIQNGYNGYVSCDPDELIAYMKNLIAHPELAHQLGERARETAVRRFGMDRFARDWNAAFQRAIELRSPATTQETVLHA